MLKFLQSKKGFTLTELMVVLILLGLGAFALVNLFRVSYRSFQKSEERYLKQEAVKEIVSKLQGSKTNVSGADIAAIYDSEDYIPESGDANYSYLFARKETFTPENGVPVEGYRLYYQNAGAVEPTPVLDETSEYYNTPIYVTFTALDANKYTIKYDGDNVVMKDGVPVTETTKVKTCGVKLRIMAMEDGATTFTEDDIYYELTVAYHFPNMATNGKGNLTNYMGGEKMANTSNQGIVLKIHVDTIVSGDNSKTGAVTPKMCFVATASYGHDSGEVGLLCDFRDTCLLTNPLGTAFVKAYYKLSPPIADVIAQHEPLRATVRVLLKPLVVFATYALNPELIYEIAPVMIITFAAGLALSVTLVRMNKKRKKKE